MQLVILAAGHGRRFGGLKQLAPVGPNGEAIMDYTARAAQSCHFDGLVVIVREDVRKEISAHIDTFWPTSMPVEFVCQGPLPGTAQAVFAAEKKIRGPFAVANADDLYGTEALRAIREHFGGVASSNGTKASKASQPRDERHILIGYELSNTVLTTEPVTRGLCDVGSSGELERIVEHTVQLRADGSFDARPLHDGESADGSVGPLRLTGHECVSMNLWGFHRRVLDELEREIADFDEESSGSSELILPDVIRSLVSSDKDSVKVVRTASRCIGITHRKDIAIVREELVVGAKACAPLRGHNGN